MRASVALTAALLAVATNAIHLIYRDNGPAVVGMGFVRKHVRDPIKRDHMRLRRRQGKTVTETLDNFEVYDSFSCHRQM